MLRITLLLLTLAAYPAGADPWWRPGGEFDLGLSTRSEPTARVDLAWPALPLAADGALRFELGAFGYVLPGKRPHETYAALAWRDRVRLGFIRPAYDDVLRSPLEQAAPNLAYQRAETGRAYATTTAMRRTAVPRGLSVRGDHGALDWAVSAHNAPVDGYASLTAALRWQGPGWHLAAATERLSEDGTISHNTKIGGGLATPAARLDLAFFHPAASGRPDALGLDLGLPAGPRVALHAFGELTRDPASRALGIGADHTLGRAGTLSAAATRAGRDTALHLTLGQRF